MGVCEVSSCTDAAGEHQLLKIISVPKERKTRKQPEKSQNLPLPKA